MISTSRLTAVRDRFTQSGFGQSVRYDIDAESIAVHLVDRQADPVDADQTFFGNILG